MEEEHTVAPTVLDRVRNMWEFASLMQYIFFFGKAVKISEDLDVEVGLSSHHNLFNVTGTLARHMGSKLSPSQELETECVKSSPSEKLPELGLTLLKHVSSHRGLTWVIPHVTS